MWLKRNLPARSNRCEEGFPGFFWSCETCLGSVDDGWGGLWVYEGAPSLGGGIRREGSGALGGLPFLVEWTECAVVKRGKGGGDVWIAAWLVGVVDSGDENAACLVLFFFVFSLAWSTQHC